MDRGQDVAKLQDSRPSEYGLDLRDQERVNHRRLRLTNGYVQRRAQGDAHLAELKGYRLELDQKRVDLSHLELQRDDLAPLEYHPALTDMAPLIDTMLARRTKLEQEAVVLAS